MTDYLREIVVIRQAVADEQHPQFAALLGNASSWPGEKNEPDY